MIQETLDGILVGRFCFVGKAGAHPQQRKNNASGVKYLKSWPFVENLWEDLCECLDRAWLR